MLNHRHVRGSARNAVLIVLAILLAGGYFALRFLLVFGLTFEFPVFLFAAAALGLVSSEALRRQRRWAVVFVVVAAALMTPGGDPLTLLLLSTPMYLLYELAILAIRFILKR